MKVLTVSKTLTIWILLYIISAWKKCITNKGYSRHWSIAQKVKFQLPTKNWEIDFDFMERFIEQLEKEKIQKLENYLEVTWLKDYNLTDEEKKVLEVFKSGEFEWWEYKIENVMTWQQKISELNPLDLESLEVSKDKIFPFYGQSTTNNGVIDYFNLNEKVLNNKLSKPTILIHSNNQNTVYLESPFYLKDWHGATSVLQSENLNKLTSHFIISSIKKIITEKFSYNAKATKIELKKTEISLPIKDNKPDYELMKTLISAIQKMVIKEVVIYTQNKMNVS